MVVSYQFYEISYKGGNKIEILENLLGTCVVDAQADDEQILYGRLQLAKSAKLI